MLQPGSTRGRQILLLPRERREADLYARDFLFIVSHRWVPQKHREENTETALGG